MQLTAVLPLGCHKGLVQCPAHIRSVNIYAMTDQITLTIPPPPLLTCICIFYVLPTTFKISHHNIVSKLPSHTIPFIPILVLSNINSTIKSNSRLIISQFI